MHFLPIVFFDFCLVICIDVFLFVFCFCFCFSQEQMYSIWQLNDQLRKKNHELRMQLETKQKREEIDRQLELQVSLLEIIYLFVSSKWLISSVIVHFSHPSYFSSPSTPHPPLCLLITFSPVRNNALLNPKFTFSLVTVAKVFRWSFKQVVRWLLRSFRRHWHYQTSRDSKRYPSTRKRRYATWYVPCVVSNTVVINLVCVLIFGSFYYS